MSKRSQQGKPQRKTHGFRLTKIDVGVIIVVIVLTAGTRPWLDSLVWLFVIVAGHFFLFCNLFRIQRVYELTWSGLFVINVSAWYVLDALDWWWVLAVQSPITALFITMSFMQRDYHGVLWRLAPNPRIVEVTDE
jgi:hypothetical protein